MSNARLAVDIGGTFTDFVLALGDGRVHRLKLHSTPHNYAEAIGDGLEQLLAVAGLPASAFREVLHATTIASNAIIEGKAARTGLITTRGFRDILEIRTLRMPRLYDLHWQKPPPLVERALRCEVDERQDASGAVRIPLDEDSVLAALDTLVAEGVQAIAVCLLHAYVNDAHERRIGVLARQRAPGVALSLSADVLPEVREYERTSTTVMNAMLQPVVAAYLDRLRAVLAERDVTAPLLLMQSAGGLMPASLAARRPVSIVESGPAAGVISAIALGAEAGLADLICFDMGGTTAKAALVVGGEASRAAEFQVGGAIMTGSRLLTGSGYTLRMPAIDLAEVGAGGGSVVWLDRGGSTAGGAAQRRRDAGAGVLRQGRHRAHHHRLRAGAGLAELGGAGRRADPARSGGRGRRIGGAHRAPARRARGRCGLRRGRGGDGYDDPCDPRRLQRARCRSTRLYAGCVRWQWRNFRTAGGAPTRHAPRADPAFVGTVLGDRAVASSG